MNIKQIIAPVLVVVGVIGALGYRTYFPPVNPDPNHTHADFAVWIEGKQMDFTDVRYMSGSSADPTTYDSEDERLSPFMHLHDGIGTVMHRHKPGLSVGDFFTTIGWKMLPDCVVTDGKKEYCSNSEKKWRMFVNEEEVPFDPTYVFQDDDRLLLEYGSSESEAARHAAAVTSDACLFSKTCPWRGEPPAENCIADPKVPCTVPVDEL